MPIFYHIEGMKKVRGKRFIYADNAATTGVSSEVLQKMLPFFKEEYGNASSLYDFGQQSHYAVEDARARVAAAIGAQAREIYFTAGGSESDNWALKGYAARMAKRGKKHIISTAFEHHAVLHTLDSLKAAGFEVTLLPVYENGIVRIEDLKNAVREDTGLVSVMFANNEIGTIQPIAEIGKFCRENGIVFHTDAVQAVGNVPIDVKTMNIDMLSMSGHKFHGPKGVGALYVRNGILLNNLIDGGAQERGKRAGTENTPGIVGMGEAIERAVATMDERNKKMKVIQDTLIENVLKIERSRLNGDRYKRLPGNVSFCFEGVEGESLLLYLDAEGICASSGSACTSGSLDPSHVLLAIGLKHEVAHGSLRLTFSDGNTVEDAERIIEVLPGIIDRLRKMSPLWDRIKKEEGNK